MPNCRANCIETIYKRLFPDLHNPVKPQTHTLKLSSLQTPRASSSFLFWTSSPSKKATNSNFSSLSSFINLPTYVPDRCHLLSSPTSVPNAKGRSQAPILLDVVDLRAGHGVGRQLFGVHQPQLLRRDHHGLDSSKGGSGSGFWGRLVGSIKGKRTMFVQCFVSSLRDLWSIFDGDSYSFIFMLWVFFWEFPTRRWIQLRCLLG